MKTLVFVALLALVACSDPPPVAPSDTGVHADAEIDAGADAGFADARAPDARPFDAGRPDSGLADQGVTEPPLVRRTFGETQADILNPERGFYTVINLVGGGSYDSVRMSGLTLAYAGVDLSAFRGSAIDAQFLMRLEAGFDRVRTAGIKLILRFVYNDGPIGADDAPKARILEHLGQLAPVLARHADVIAFMQAGFIGAWGEWHSSTNGLDNAADRNEILLAILRALPRTRMVQVRTPNFVRDSFPTAVDEMEAFTGSLVARTGHHNDCFLASDDDMGTYPDPVDTWRTGVASDTRFVAMGGETCRVFAPRSECTSALAELEQLHFTYLNSLYHPDVLAAWRTGGCLETIRRRLGHRLVLDETFISQQVKPGGVLRLRARIRNTGWAPLYNARPVEVVLEDGAGTRSVATLTRVDPRRWAPGTAIHEIDVRLRVPANAEPGTSQLSLWLPDASPSLRDRSEYAVHFLSENVWDSLTGFNILTQLPIDRNAPGEADPTAMGFEELP